MERKGRLGLVAWAFYDWGNSAFSAVVQTFVFAVYFTTQVAQDPVQGSAQWGAVVGIGGLVVALFGPILGAIADHGGRRKPLIVAFTLVGVVATALLFWVRPTTLDLPLALGWILVATVATEFAFIFYNAMLADIAPPDKVGWWSGMGWALGYVGGVGALLLSLLLLDLGAQWPQAMAVRATSLLAAVWYLLFSFPLFFLTPDTPSTGKRPLRAIRDGLKQLGKTLGELGHYGAIFRFLLARMFFTNGLTTLFTFGGVYAAGVFGMGTAEVLWFGIALNVASGLGAALFAWVDDRWGGKRVTIGALVGLLVPGVLILFTQSRVCFWGMGLLIGIFVGPAQAASRSYMARVAPPAMRNEMFGLFALSGKATSFMGPWLVAWLTALSHSQRVGMGAIPALLLVGLALMLTVPSDRV